MRAAVFHEAGKPLTIETVADPRPQPGQIVIAVSGAGICGSDLHMTQHPGFAAPGLILGHEFAGTVAALVFAEQFPMRGFLRSAFVLPMMATPVAIAGARPWMECIP